MLLPVLAINVASNSPLPLTEPVYIFCILLLSIAAAPLIAKPLHLPPLVVLIVLGGILGSNVTGILARDSQLILLEKIGLLYIMLLAGLQMDLSKFRLVGARSLIFGLLTFSVPLTAGIISGHWLTTNSLGSALLGILYSPHTLVSYPIVTVLGIVKKRSCCGCDRRHNSNIHSDTKRIINSASHSWWKRGNSPVDKITNFLTITSVN